MPGLFGLGSPFSLVKTSPHATSPVSVKANRSSTPFAGMDPSASSPHFELPTWINHASPAGMDPSASSPHFELPTWINQTSPARTDPSSSSPHFEQGDWINQDSPLRYECAAPSPHRATESSTDACRLAILEQQLKALKAEFQERHEEGRHSLQLLDHDLNHIKTAVQNDLRFLDGRISRLEDSATAPKTVMPFQSNATRSHDEKLHGSWDNEALRMIATGEHIPPGMTMAEAYSSQAENADALAETYISQVQNAEALAAELRSYADELGDPPTTDFKELTLNQYFKDDSHHHERRIEEWESSPALSAGNLTAKTTNCAIKPDESISVVMCNDNTAPATSRTSHTLRDLTDNPILEAKAAVSTPSNPWKPAYIASLHPFHPDITDIIPPASTTQTFTYAFLASLFGDRDHISEYSPSLFWVSKKVSCILPRRTFYLLDASTEPFLPERPGQHGAKLTPFFHPEVGGDDEEDSPGQDALFDAPVFVALRDVVGEANGGSVGKEGGGGGEMKEKEYVYFGQYSHTRWSDRLDYDRMLEVVPEHVKDHWSNILTQPSRPKWLTAALITHFYPPLPYDGPLPPVSLLLGDNGDHEDATTPATETLNFASTIIGEVPNAGIRKAAVKYINDLAIYAAEDAADIAFLTKEKVRAAFDEPDTASIPGLRLHWEYLECVNYDSGFYNMLVTRKEAQLEEGGGKKEGFDAAKQVAEGVETKKWPGYDALDVFAEKGCHAEW